MEQQSKSTSINHNYIQVDGLSTDFFNPVVHRYLKSHDFPDELVNTDRLEDIAHQILSQRRFNFEYRQTLVKEILGQYERSGIELASDSITHQNIHKLLDDNTLTVTTGQQIHIFLGPQFVVSKILSCCAQSKSMEEHLAPHQVVPIFWMASEDHDFDEIRKAVLYNEEYVWELDSNGPVGRLAPQSLLPLVEQARNRIDQNEDNLRFLELCEYAYRNNSTFADATRYILHHYLGDTGIVILDPDSAELKARLSSNIKHDLLEHTNSAAIDVSIDRMKSAGIKAPINTRPINYFYLTDNERLRIERNDDSFSLVGSDRVFSDAELLKELEHHPERFSPNALLRPLYQQTILPNLVYVCGGSEFIYWLELKEMFDRDGVIYPKLEPRKSIFFVAQKNIEALEKEKLTASAIFLEEDRLKQHFTNKHDSEYRELNAQADEIKKKLEEVITRLERKAGHPLSKLIKQANKTTHQLNSEIQDRYAHDDLPDQLVRILRFKSKIWSNDQNQERSKDIVSVIPDLKTVIELFKNDYKSLLNNIEITVIKT